MCANVPRAFPCPAEDMSLGFAIFKAKVEIPSLLQNHPPSGFTAVRIHGRVLSLGFPSSWKSAQTWCVKYPPGASPVHVPPSVERFHFHAVLGNLFVGGSGASASISAGLRGLLTIRLIFSQAHVGLKHLNRSRVSFRSNESRFWVLSAQSLDGPLSAQRTCATWSSTRASEIMNRCIFTGNSQWLLLPGSCDEQLGMIIRSNGVLSVWTETDPHGSASLSRSVSNALLGRMSRTPASGNA
jgi:hypothetical protein